MTLEFRVQSDLIVTIDDRFECSLSYQTAQLTSELGGIATISEVTPGVVNIAEAHDFLEDPYYEARQGNIVLWPADVWPQVKDQYK